MKNFDEFHEATRMGAFEVVDIDSLIKGLGDKPKSEAAKLLLEVISDKSNFFREDLRRIYFDDREEFLSMQVLDIMALFKYALSTKNGERLISTIGKFLSESDCLKKEYRKYLPPAYIEEEAS